MDGHSAQVNITLSEFCRANKIILYCLPPHASHILQPLDISVYGPLKKQWSISINNFQRKFHQTVSRANFFPIFDKALEAVKRNTQIVESGFKKSGLLPFNPNAPDYSKIINEQSAISDFKSSRDEPNADTKLGITMALKAFESQLSDDKKSLFQRRFQEGYDAGDDEHYNSYRAIKILLVKDPAESNSFSIQKSSLKSQSIRDNTLVNFSLKESQPLSGSEPHMCVCDSPSNTQSSGIELVHPLRTHEEPPAEFSQVIVINEPEIRSLGMKAGTSIDQSSTADKQTTMLDESRSEICLKSPTLDEEPCTSDNHQIMQLEEFCFSSPINVGSNLCFYGNRKFSPFKQYLKIDKSLVTSKQEQKSKPPHPPAVSGNDYFKNLLNKQNEKQQLMIKKIERQEQRRKKAFKKKRGFQEEDTQAYYR